jgi:hypothetical protein
VFSGRRLFRLRRQIGERNSSSIRLIGCLATIFVSTSRRYDLRLLPGPTLLVGAHQSGHQADIELGELAVGIGDRIGGRRVLGRTLLGPRLATPSRLGELPRPVQCLVDEGKHRGLECISILPVRLG